MSDDLEPIAWEVTAVADRAYVNGKRPVPIRERFQCKDDAAARRIELQEAGMAAIALVPVFPNKKQREAHNRDRQYAPFGDFCADWTMKD